MATEFEVLFEDGFDDLLLTVGEQVTYVKRDGECRRTIDAIVDRSPGEVWVAGEIMTPTLVVRVHNDETCGISHAEIDAGDRVVVELRRGAYPSVRAFVLVENSDGGVTDIAVK